MEVIQSARLSWAFSWSTELAKAANFWMVLLHHSERPMALPGRLGPAKKVENMGQPEENGGFMGFRADLCELSWCKEVQYLGFMEVISIVHDFKPTNITGGVSPCRKKQ